MLISKGVVNTLAIDSHVLHQNLDRRSLVTARPENLHGFVEDFIAIELFLSRHSLCLGNPLYSFWNEQSRIRYLFVVTSLSFFRLRIISLLTRVNGLLPLNPFPDIRRTLNKF